MIPNNIKREHILKAFKEIDTNGYPDVRKPRLYEIDYNGKTYPPKHTISIANEYINGEELPIGSFNGGTETNNFLETLGFTISKKNIDSNAINYWIFQANPKFWNVFDGLKMVRSIYWQVNQHKGNINVGDKVIVWVTGNKSGCYTLGHTISEIFKGPDKPSEQNLYVQGSSDEILDRIEVEIDINLVDRPILKEDITSNPIFNDFKGGTQGTNFRASREQYNELLRLSDMGSNIHYWIYAPGQGATKWNECINESIMIIGWDDLGDLNQYKDKKEIHQKLKETYKSNDPVNNSLACYQFCNEIKQGDIIIPKRGRELYLGYGIVESEYIYDDSREEFKHIRKVNWIKKGEWKDPRPDYKITLKTLTDVTEYKDYIKMLREHIGIETTNLPTSENPFPLNIILYGPPGTGKTYNTVNYALAIIKNKSLEEIENESIELGRRTLIERFNDYKQQDQIRFITFHQSYSYEDFIQGLRPNPNDSTGSLSFELRDGVFKEIADSALRNYKEFVSGEGETSKLTFHEAFGILMKPIKEDPEYEIEIGMARKDYSFFITGVTEKHIKFRKNNGDTSHTLNIAFLERMYENEELGNTQGLLSYYSPLLDKLLELRKSEEVDHTQKDLKKFVIIIDEINRANISRVFGELITLIEQDKRYGEIHELTVTLPSGETFAVPPNLYILGTMNTADKSIALLDIALRRRFDFIKIYPDQGLVLDVFRELFTKLNEAITNERGPDFQIGHSYFMGNDTTDLKIIMNNKVIPLLYEYFMNDGETVNKILSRIGIKTKNSLGLYEFESYGNE